MSEITSTNACLVIIDMVNGFIHEGPMADASIKNIIVNIEELIKSFHQNHQPIIAFLDKHPENAKEFTAFVPHCVANTSESEWVEELLSYQNDVLFIEKNSVNGFLAPDFQQWFEKAPLYQQYVITGCVSDICVLQFALTLQAYIHQHNLDATVTVCEDAIATFDAPFHPKDTYHTMAIAFMKQCGIHITTSKEITL